MLHLYVCLLLKGCVPILTDAPNGTSLVEHGSAPSLRLQTHIWLQVKVYPTDFLGMQALLNAQSTTTNPDLTLIKRILLPPAMLARKLCDLAHLLQVFRVLGREGINVKMMSQGASKTNISLIVDDSQGQHAVRCLHQEFFDSEV